MKVETYFGSVVDAYRLARVPYPRRFYARNREQQRADVISFIKENPTCTVTDIRKEVRVNVRKLFGGIRGAYRAAMVPYPDRPAVRGVMSPDVIRRSIGFEEMICSHLEKAGLVFRQFRCSAGIIDALLSTSRGIVLVEVKDFMGRNNITAHQTKQVFAYLDALGLPEGWIITHPYSLPPDGTRVIFKSGRRIRILTPSELGL